MDERLEHGPPEAAPCRRCGRCWGELSQAGGASGGRLVAWSAGVFLLPVLTAIAGAVLAGPAAPGMLAGACGGLLAGSGAAAAVARLARRAGRKRQTT